MASNKVRDWDLVVQQLYQEIPEAENVDWRRVFEADPKILGSIINDIIKVAVSQKGRPGKRSVGSEEAVAADLRKLAQLDYADVPFQEAMFIQMEGRSLRQVANNCDLDKMTIRRLSLGRGTPPTPYHMEQLAKAFRKDPSYFMEYRALYVCSAIYEMLMANSDSASIFYKKIRAY